MTLPGTSSTSFIFSSCCRAWYVFGWAESGSPIVLLMKAVFRPPKDDADGSSTPSIGPGGSRSSAWVEELHIVMVCCLLSEVFCLCGHGWKYIQLGAQRKGAGGHLSGRQYAAFRASNSSRATSLTELTLPEGMDIRCETVYRLTRYIPEQIRARRGQGNRVPARRPLPARAGAAFQNLAHLSKGPGAGGSHEERHRRGHGAAHDRHA